MNPPCVLCGTEGFEVHHMVPKFAVELFSVDVNCDLWRVWLCKKHHDEISRAWDGIRFSAKRLVANHDDWMETKYGENIWTWLGLMATGHDISHEETECKECNRPQESLWIKQLLENGAPEGKRHLSRYKVMLHLKKRGLSDDEIYQKVFEFNSKCSPPEAENTVKSHIKSTLRQLGD